jgi:sec-independent protein translocase protein TatA
MELVIVLAIALIILGPKRLPAAGKSLGRGMREFKDSLSGAGKDDEMDLELPTTTVATAKVVEVPVAERAA